MARKTHPKSEYDFTLKFNIPDDLVISNDYLGILATEGCDDALVGLGNQGKIALNFIREAASAKAAVFTAIQDVKRAIPQAVLTEVSPDLISLTEVAKILGCTRQNIRNLIVKGEPKSPSPIYGGTPSLWHLSDILHWLSEEKNYPIASSLLELAKVNKNLNIAKDWQTVDSDQKLEIKSFFAENCA